MHFFFDYRGICNACQTSLKPVQLTDKQFELVKNEFVNKVVKGDDIYRKTTVKEWASFENVLKEKGPFDIVMDGLNVAYSTATDMFRREYSRNLGEKWLRNLYHNLVRFFIFVA